MYHYSELANAVRIKNRQQDGSDPFADYSDEELANAYQTKYPELGKQINWGMDYSGQLNRAASTPQMVLPGGRIAQAPAVGVFADPVSPTSMGAFATTAPARLTVPVQASGPVRIPTAKPAQYVAPILAEEQERQRLMAQPSLTPGERAAQEERELVAQHEAEYQDYVKQYDSEWEADKKNRSGRAILDYRLSSGKRPLTRDEFARAKSGYSVPEAWMTGDMAGIATRERTALQAVGEASEFLMRTAMAPAVRVIDAAAGVAPGFSDLSHASNVRRNFETQARAQDIRNAEAAGSALTEGEAAYLDENDPNVVVSSVRALKGLPDMAKELWDNPEARRQAGVSMVTDLPGSLVLSGGASVALDVVKAGKNMLRMRNVVKSLEGRVAKGTMTTEQAAKGIARFKQTEYGGKAIEEMWQAVRKNPGMASGILKETLGDGLADAVIETINGQGRGEQTWIVENLISGMPIDIAPYLAINAGKRAVNGPDNGLNRADFDAARSVLELAPTIENKMGVPVMPGHVLDENGNVVMNTKKGKEQYALTQKAGSTATRPQVEAAMQRPDLKDRMRDLAAMARNPETADMKYRLGNEDISLELTPEELRAASYGNREGAQTVNGYNQQRKGYEYAQNEDGTIRSIETQRPVAHITRNGGASTIAHETIHGIEDKVRKIGTDAAEGTGDAKFLDMVDDWTERAYEWGRRHGVMLPGQKELLTHAMTYRLGHDGDYDASIAQLPVPDDLVREFSKRGGAALVGPQGLRLDGTIMDDMPLPERETKVEPTKAEGIEIPELDEGEELPFSFAGKRAANADLGKLAEAEDRLDAMEDRDKVRKSTGWFRGADGKMRFEVDDSGVDLQKPFPKQGQPWGMIHDEMFKRDVESGSGKYGPTVGDMLGDAPILREYPEFREMNVNKGKGTGGAFIRARDGIDPAHIEIGEDVPMSDVRSILLHEIQHAIQGQEEFARGSSPETEAMSQKKAVRLREIMRWHKELKAEAAKRWPGVRFDSDMRRNLDNEMRNEYYREGLPEFVPSADLLEEYFRYPGKYWDERENAIAALVREHGLDERVEPRSAKDDYRRSAGETEARNTQTRRDLTADQRRESAPWDTQDVKDGEQIVRFSLASDAGIPQHRADDPATIELARKQWAEKGVESPFFKKWFRGSKVVDAEGKPLVVYHGTASDFTEFKRTKATDKEGRKIGMGWGKSKFYFTDTPESASVAADWAAQSKDRPGKQPSVMPVYLAIKKPISADDFMRMVSEYTNSGMDRDAAISAVDAELNRRGVDGIVDDVSGGFATFSPTQIKSATGNRGTFESESPDIRFSLASDAGIPEGRADDPKVVEAARKAWKEKGVESPWFKRWFGDSKVVDEQGKPLVVYHGSKADFNIFDLQRAGRNGQALGIGFYFTNSESIASGYGNTNSFYLKMNNPALSVKKKTITRVQVKKILDILEKEDEYLLSNYGDVSTSGRASVMNDALNDVHGESANDVDVITSLVNMSGIPRESVMNAVINVTGKDGLFVPADIASSGAESGDNVYVALLPTQIKSATGNRGTFESESPDIRFSLASDAGIPEGRADDPKAVEAARKAWKEKGVESPWFKRWFGDSKVVDADGKPLVVYHGTFTPGFSSFDLDKGGSATGAVDSKKAFYFTSSSDYASKHVYDQNPYEVAQRIKAVLNSEDLPISDRHEIFALYQKAKDGAFIREKEFALLQKYGINDDTGLYGQGVVPAYVSLKSPLIVDFKGRAWDEAEQSRIMRRAVELDADGVILRNIDEGHGPVDDFIVFSPTQIKSATGNRGTFDGSDADIRYSLAKSDPRQKILSHVTRAMRENGLKPMAQNDMSSEWGTISKKAKSDPVQRAKEVKAWDAVEESLRRFVADNPAIAAEAGLKPPAEGHLDEFDVAGAVDQFRVWTNSSTQGKHTAEELDHFAQARDAAQNGPGATEYSDHPMTKRSLLSIAKTHKMGNMIRFKSLGEKFNAEWAPEKKAWVVTRAGGKESFELPRDGSVWVDGERARAPEFDEDTYPLRDDRNLRAANAEQTTMGEGDLEKTESEESRLDALARHVQDSMRDLRKLQERVKNKEADPYREYDLAAGRGDHSGAKMREKFLRPILQLMEKHDLDQNVVDSYLYARHAAERNKSVAEKNPDFQDGGSGMKTKDAEEILRNFAQDAVRNQALESIGKISDKLNEWRLDMLVKSGLLSEVDAKAMQAAWKHYVPLRGVPGDEDARPGVFRGKVAKQDKKKAMGRKYKAESVLAQNFAVTLDAIVNAQRNIAARELWKMAGANPDPKYWELDPSYVRNVQGKDGQVTQMADLQRMQKAPGIVPVFIKGEPHYIEFKTPEGGRIAAAIKELNQEQSNTLIRGLGKVNRFVGSMITQYSPEFVLTNFSRDYLTALTVAYARDGVKIARRMVTQAPAAVVGLARSKMGLRNDWTDWEERWENAGGKVGFMQSKDFKTLADDIEDDLKDLNRSNYNPKKWANVVGKVVESANGSVESATRLAYFRALVENGVDEKVAAQKSKELTVNFNRRGDWKWANQYWMFFNASVQGSANIAKLFTDKDPDVRKRAYAAAGAIASAGAAVALYNQFLGGEDEDSGKTHYERLPGWAKNNAAVLLNPKSKDGSALTIPLPYGLNVIWNTGRMMAEGASRQDGFTAMDAASEIAGSIVGSFSPFGADIDPGNVPGTLLGLATPTAAKPWMELALNKNFAGRPVMPENIPGMTEKPESELYFQGVNPYARELAAFLNTETGGDKWHAGGVSVSPEKMEHVFNAYTGGVGRLLQQGLGIAKTWGEGNETTIRQWPFARRFFSSAPEGVDRSAFMAEVLNPAKQDLAQKNEMAENEDADVEQFVDEHYANIVASAAFGGLKTKEKRLKRAEELGEKIGTSGVKEEYRSFFAKAWKAKREMDALQEELNSTTDQAKRAELRNRIEKEAEKAFEGFGE